MTAAEQILDEIASYAADPLGFAQFAFPWGEPGPLENESIREWQADVFNTIGKHLQSPFRFQPLKIAIASGHGIGKTAEIAMICSWAMSTCDDCRVLVTANTEDQLTTKTWPEMVKWFGLSINRDWWNISATRITSRQAGHESTWRLDRETWSENNTEAFQGLHNRRKRIVLIFDEGSAIPKTVWDVAEGALTDEDTEIIFLVFGNPTQNDTPFAECFGAQKHRWVTRHIDSRTVPGTNKEQIDRWIADFGEDSDFVRVRVRGEFPRAGGLQFIPQDLVAAARKRQCQPSGYKIMSVDVARSGFNQTVVGWRWGQVAHITDKWRGLSIPDQSGRIALRIMEEDARCVIIDGDGIGGAVSDHLRMMLPKPNQPVKEWPDTALTRWFKTHPWFTVQEFHGGLPAADKFMYFNKRAEVWGKVKTWLEHADIDDDPELERDLTGPRFDTDNPKSVIQLERKEDMRDRGVDSPDCFVAGTMIRTPSGERPIESLKVGDQVLTPFGPSRICVRHVSMSDRLTTVRFSSGSILTGKGKHKVFTWTGAKRLDILSMTDEVESWSWMRYLEWRCVSLFFTEARIFGFKQAVDTFNPGARVRLRDFCIAGFGLTTLGRFLKALRSTIKTMIGAIATLTTSNSWPVPITEDFTLFSAMPLRLDMRHRCEAWRLEETRQRSGIGPNRAGRGIVKPRLTTCGDQTEPCFRAPVSDAIPSSRLSLLERCIAPIAAFRKQPTRVVDVQTESARELTYNLTLRENNAYWANGILVFNCGDQLCMTFAANPMAETREEKTKREQAAIKDPMELHFARLRETQRREKLKQGGNYWDT